MAIKRVLDLNTAQRPTLELTLCDKERTVLHIGMPTEADINELQAMDFSSLESGEQADASAVYDMAARLINCNRDGVKVTGKSLRTKYGMDLELAVVFFEAYTEFINTIANEKN
jgi:hypothetical protein